MWTFVPCHDWDIPRMLENPHNVLNSSYMYTMQSMQSLGLRLPCCEQPAPLTPYCLGKTLDLCVIIIYWTLFKQHQFLVKTPGCSPKSMFYLQIQLLISREDRRYFRLQCYTGTWSEFKLCSHSSLMVAYHKPLGVWQTPRSSCIWPLFLSKTALLTAVWGLKIPAIYNIIKYMYCYCVYRSIWCSTKSS